MFSTNQIAAEVAAPLSQTKKVVMVSSGKGEIGASKLTSEVLQIVEKLPGVVEGLTGINILKVSHVLCDHQFDNCVCNFRIM